MHNIWSLPQADQFVRLLTIFNKILKLIANMKENDLTTYVSSSQQAKRISKTCFRCVRNNFKDKSMWWPITGKRHFEYFLSGKAIDLKQDINAHYEQPAAGA